MAPSLPLRRLATCLDGRRVPLNREQRSEILGDIPYWGANGVVDRIDRHLFDECLVLLGEDGAPFFESGRNVAFVVDEAVWVNNHMHVLRPRLNTDARFLAYALNSVDYARYITGSTRDKLTQDDMWSIVIPHPELQQQRAVADYLDRETARIDAMIERKRQMIELLVERLTAKIDALVWGRESGGELDIDLLDGWSSPSLSLAIRIAEGQVDPTKNPYRDYPLIAPNHIESGTGRLLYIESAAEQGAISGKYICQAGDVIYSKIRPALCKAVVAPERCVTSADMYPIRPGRDLLSGFLLYFFLSKRFTELASLESERVAMPKINRDALGRIKVPRPPLAHQQEVVASLDQLRQWTEVSADVLKHQIDLLVEHRQTLITAAVSGQIDIDGKAA